MRVLVWTELFWPYFGGSTRISLRLIRALGVRGFTFLVITRRDSLELAEREELEGVVVHRLPFCQAVESRDPGQVLELKQRVSALKREFAPDLVHMHGLGPGGMFHLLTDQGTPFLLTLHGELGGRAEGMRRLVGRADRVVAPSRATAAYAVSLGGCPKVVFNGVALAGEVPAPLPEAPRLLCLGRLDRVKGFDLALEALAELPGVGLTVAGGGPERARLEELARGLDVEFRGPVAPQEVVGLLEGATALVAPSRSEGLPLAVLEALARGRPVVASAVGGIPEAVLPGRTGLLVPPEDSKALARALVELLDDPEEAARMGREGWRLVAERFSWSAQVDAYEELYRTLTGPA